MDMDNEYVVDFFVLLILLLQGFRFHIEMPHFLGFLPSDVVATNIEEIIIMSICLFHNITYNLGLLPIKLDH
jgi:hypothetical protein